MTTKTIIGLSALVSALHGIAVPTAGAQKQAPALAGNPSVSLSDFDAVAAVKLNASSLRMLERTIRGSEPSSTELPDLMFALATLHWQDHRYWTTLGSKPAASSKKEAKRAAQGAIKVFAKLAKDHPNYARMDEALYGLARMSAAAGRLDVARKTFMRLIRNYPRSKLIPNAYASFGDYFAEQNKLAHAGKFYDKVLEFPKSRIYPYGLYRAAWVKIKQGQATHALQLLVRVVQSAQTATVAALDTAVRSDIVQLYASIGQPARAGAFFRRIDRAGARGMLNDLADTYRRRGLSAQAAEVSQQASAQDPALSP